MDTNETLGIDHASMERRQREADAKDAARYRWLVKNHAFAAAKWGTDTFKIRLFGDIECDTRALLIDDAIDAAMRAEDAECNSEPKL